MGLSAERVTSASAAVFYVVVALADVEFYLLHTSSKVGQMGKVLIALSPAPMYLYLGAAKVKGLRGYMWLLGRRLYFKTSWRARDTHYLGRLEGLLTAKLRRLAGGRKDGSGARLL